MFLNTRPALGFATWVLVCDSLGLVRVDSWRDRCECALMLVRLALGGWAACLDADDAVFAN